MLGLTASGVLGEPMEIFPGIGLRKAITNVKHSTKDNYSDQIIFGHNLKRIFFGVSVWGG